MRSMLLLLVVGCGASTPESSTTTSATSNVESAEAAPALPSQEGVCGGSIPPGEYFFGREAKLGVDVDGQRFDADLFGFVRLRYLGAVSEVGTESEQASAHGRGSIVEIPTPEGAQRAIVGLQPPSLCLTHTVSITDGEMEIRMDPGTAVGIVGWEGERARVTHDFFGHYSVVVPTDWLSTEGCTSEGLSAEGRVVRTAEGVDPSTCLLPAPGFRGSDRGQLLASAEPVQVLEEREGWMKVRAFRGPLAMTGWIRERPQAGPQPSVTGIRLTRDIELPGSFDAPAGTPGFVRRGEVTLRIPFSGGELWPYTRVDDTAYEETGDEVSTSHLFALSPNIVWRCDQGEQRSDLGPPTGLDAHACPPRSQGTIVHSPILDSLPQTEDETLP